MQSEDLDKKLKDAADHHHPAYNEHAWSKMKDLLDTHMPVEKRDRRRGFILFLLLFMLVGGGAWFIITRPGDTATSLSESVSNPEKSNSNNTGSSAVTETENKQATTANPSELTGSNPGTIKPGGNDPNTIVADKPQTDKTILDKPNQAGLSQPPLLTRKSDFIPIKPVANKKKRDDTPISTQIGVDDAVIVKASQLPNMPVVKSDQPQTEPKVDLPLATVPVDKTDPHTTIPNSNSVTEPASVKSNAVDVTAKTETDTKPTQTVAAKKKRHSNGFSFSVSAGPDISGVGLDEWGKVKPVYGIGLGYTFADRFTIRTGFYTASKIYTAYPKDYKPASPPPSQTYLNKIDADCRVYEIPLNLAYSFGKSEKQNWFASAGLSSFLMKRETYDYVYKYPNGSTYSHLYEYENKNSHFLSILSLSGGYTRRLNRTFSLSAEPYFKMPLGGVGVGNIKLNSAGVMFTLGARINK